MQHTLAAVFDNRTSAQQAMDELTRCGFPRQDMALKDSTTDDEAARSDVAVGERDESFGQSVLHFFSDLFGAHHADTHVYTEAVSRGNTVLTYVTDDQDKIERAADIIEAYGPVDIDEYESQWRAGGWTGAEGMRVTPTYEGQGASLQSTTAGASTGAGTANLQGGSQQGSASQGSMQRETIQGSAGSMPASSDQQVKLGERTGQTGGVRVYSRIGESPSSADEESYYRVHYASHMAILGGNFDAYAPAYRYGAALARDPSYSASSWDEVESRVRTDWEAKHPGSAWERFKNAIRHGWEHKTVPDDDDSYYRSHWKLNYGDEGSNYDEYAPAYKYGSSMASETARGRSWEDVETYLRSDWEARNPGSAWERFKSAVRHGWERITT
ncbi:MAG TPA: hypothetical protein VFT37_06000 [Telluria sp.]|nr:hypothetical protein [Telluria sp.]